MGITFIINLSYLIGSIAFIWGLRLMSSPDTARRGNHISAVAMGITLLATLAIPLEKSHGNYLWIVAALAIGGAIGYIVAKRVAMTSMPQMVSILNGLGGACAVLLSGVELIHYYEGSTIMTTGQLGIILLTLLIGAVAFTGSLLAYLKLEGKVKDSKLILPGHQVLNLLMLGVIIVMSVYLVIAGTTAPVWVPITVVFLSLVYGFSFVVPIGGADMPVVISLLNSFSGLSAAAAGLIYNSQIMLVGGILVGASGIILTLLMCRAMNRSLLNVVIGGFGGGGAAAVAAEGGQVVKEVSMNDAAIQLFYSQSVMVVPGYGLAVAQAQKICKEIDDILSGNGVDVKYAIHPVAGRMPGHMNVLLAEADVPYPKLLDLEEANNALPSIDVCVIIGANDVVNPAAETDPGSPIYGMPVLQVWKAKHVIVLKRGMSAGYAGIENALFFHERTKMLFGDAKATLSKLVTELKGL